jgi:hypothetical protein
MDIQQEHKDFADGIAEQLSNGEPRFTRLFVAAPLHHFVTARFSFAPPPPWPRLKRYPRITRTWWA